MYNEERLQKAYETGKEEWFFDEIYKQTREIKPSNMADILSIVDLLQILNRARNKIEDNKFLFNEFHYDTLEYYSGIKIRLLKLMGLPNFFDIENWMED